MSIIGRNDACPCGSGQKYKRCCLAKDEAARVGGLERRQAALRRREAALARPKVPHGERQGVRGPLHVEAPVSEAPDPELRRAVQQAIDSVPRPPGFLGVTANWRSGRVRLRCAYRGPIGVNEQQHAIRVESVVMAAVPGLVVDIDVQGAERTG